MEKIKIVIKKNSEITEFNRDVYNKDVIDVQDKYILQFITNTFYIHKTMTKVRGYVRKFVKSISEMEGNFISQMYRIISNMKTREEALKLLDIIKEKNQKLLIKQASKNNKDDEGNLTNQVELLELTDQLSINLNKFSDLVLATFIHRVLTSYFEPKMEEYSIDELKDMNEQISKGSYWSIDKIYEDPRDKNKEAFEGYCDRIISDLIYKTYYDKLENLCWEKKCGKANIEDCTRINYSGMDIRKTFYNYVKEGVLFLDYKGEIKRCVVLRCLNYEKSDYKEKDVDEIRSYKDDFLKDSTRQVVKMRFISLRDHSYGKNFSNTSYTNDLTEEEKNNMKTMKERRNKEIEELKEEKERLQNKVKKKAKNLTNN